MKTRTAPQSTPTKAPRLTRAQWEQLLKLACQKAEGALDPRLGQFQRALGTGEAERILRLHSIISEQDLTREFSSQNR
jgi:hypothetical protein